MLKYAIYGAAFAICGAMQVAGYLHAAEVAYGTGGDGRVSIKDILPYIGALAASVPVLLGAFWISDRITHG